MNKAHIYKENLRAARNLAKCSIQSRQCPSFWKNIKQYRSSDTLYILGSGDSINKINRWDIVRKADSVGFNFWLIHDFVPKFYFYEAPRNPAHAKIMTLLIKEKAIDLRNTIAFNKIRKNSTIIDQALRDAEIPYRHFYPTTFSAASTPELRDYCAWYKASHVKKIFLYSQGVASVEMLVMFGWLMGYKEVVLCGIDMNNSKYFYSSYHYNELKKRGLIPKHNQIDSMPHKTNDPAHCHSGIPASEVLKTYQEVLLLQECQIYVENTSSFLSSYFPVKELR